MLHDSTVVLVPVVILLGAKAILMTMIMITCFHLRSSTNCHVDITDNKDLTTVKAVLNSTPV